MATLKEELMRRFHALTIVTVALAANTTFAQDKGNLNIYCSMQIEWCTLAANEFTKQTGIKVNTSFKGSGETFAQVKAESTNPKGDVWFGGTGDPHLQAAEEGLSEVYQSPLMKDVSGANCRLQNGGHLRRCAGL
jgi:iron(III) transport system substrate-binding protein